MVFAMLKGATHVLQVRPARAADSHRPQQASARLQVPLLSCCGSPWAPWLSSQGTLNLLAIVLAAWWLIEFKNRALRWFATCILSDE